MVDEIKDCPEVIAHLTRNLKGSIKKYYTNFPIIEGAVFCYKYYEFEMIEYIYIYMLLNIISDLLK